MIGSVGVVMAAASNNAVTPLPVWAWWILLVALYAAFIAAVVWILKVKPDTFSPDTRRAMKENKRLSAELGRAIERYMKRR